MYSNIHTSTSAREVAIQSGTAAELVLGLELEGADEFWFQYQKIK